MNLTRHEVELIKTLATQTRCIHNHWYMNKENEPSLKNIIKECDEQIEEFEFVDKINRGEIYGIGE